MYGGPHSIYGRFARVTPTSSVPPPQLRMGENDTYNLLHNKPLIKCDNRPMAGSLAARNEYNSNISIKGRKIQGVPYHARQRQRSLTIYKCSK